MTNKTSIPVAYKCVDGWHVFSSPSMPGLYVSSQDAEKAFHDVGPSIEVLFEMDEGVKIRAVAESKLSEFLAEVKGYAAEPKPYMELSDRRFALLEAA